MPTTERGTSLDEYGICQACQNSEQKMHIDWRERYEALANILAKAKAQAGDNYDCILPISGGKDSFFQTYLLTRVFGVKPLAVTFNHNWYSETGWYNLQNTLETFNVDHVMFSPNRGLINKLAKRAVDLVGDPCWHCHAGIGAFTLKMARAYGVKLVVFGESSNENFGRSSYYEPEKATRDYFIRMSAKATPEAMVDGEITTKDVHPFQYISQEEFDEAGIVQIHLGNYVFWDDERQTEFVRDHFGWKETEIENSYKCYKSAECVMPGMHDLTCYLKRGFGRATFQANIDVRNGLLTREEGFEIAKQVDGMRPEALEYYKEITGQTEEEFFASIGQHRKVQLAEAELPMVPRTRPNREVIRPFVQQLIDKHRAIAPPRETEMVRECSPGAEPLRLGTFYDASIKTLVRAMAEGRIAPGEIAQACVGSFEKHDGWLRAFEVFDADLLRVGAGECEARLAAGRRLRMLEAMPVGVKDIYNTVDFPTQMGSVLWDGFTPGNDARLVYNLKDAGALVPGKTVTAELAVHSLPEGKTVNPHARDRTPGTSSSGSAAAVSMGMIPAALGSQTAASITRPASFCGVYGMKPSFGLLPRTGVLKTTDSLDSLGFFSVWYEDLQLLFEALRAKGENFPLSNAALGDQARQAAPQGRPWRVALVKTHTWDHAPDYAREAFLGWAGALGKEQDMEVHEIVLPEPLEQSHEIHATIYNCTLAYYFAEEYKKAEFVSPVLQRMIQSGYDIGPKRYHAALARQEELCEDMDSLLGGYDAMVSLSTAGEAPGREVEELPDPGLMWTLTHLPVIGAPVFRSPGGLPFGLQIVARRYNDYRLFRFADELVKRGLIPETGVRPAALDS